MLLSQSAQFSHEAAPQYSTSEAAFRIRAVGAVFCDGWCSILGHGTIFRGLGVGKGGSIPGSCCLRIDMHGCASCLATMLKPTRLRSCNYNLESTFRTIMAVIFVKWEKSTAEDINSELLLYLPLKGRYIRYINTNDRFPRQRDSL